MEGSGIPNSYKIRVNDHNEEKVVSDVLSYYKESLLLDLNELRTDNKTIPTTNTVVNLLTPNQTIRTVYTQADPTMSNKSTGVGG
uniref:Uncharacterized protein n=1 Tax=Helianthus annuus TaxID=4232 RepID=A0A251V9K0_HELAN